jgi:ATP-binding cassette subfamily F protein uup
VIVPEGGGVWNEYAGGYSDMLTQRGADIASTKPARTAASKETKAAAGAPEAPKQKKKLSFNEKFALDNLPKQIAKLEDDIRALQQKLDDPGLYIRDRKAFDAATDAMAKAQADLAAAEEKWLELEMLREEIEG